MELVINKTYKYLYPCLAAYPELRANFNSVSICKVGLHDYNLDLINDKKQLIQYDYNIFIQVFCDNPLGQNNYEELINKIRQHPSHVVDYIVTVKTVKFLKSHMIVINIPKKYHRTYDHFLAGNYSLMYSTEDLDKYFSNLGTIWKNTSYPVLSKDPVAINQLKDYLKQEFDSKDLPTILTEYDLPLKYKEECFNYTNLKVFI